LHLTLVLFAFLPLLFGCRSWSTHWFKLDVVIPAEWRGRRVVLVWDSNSEAMLYEDNKCLQAFTGAAHRMDASVL
jgi:hypothetical protein